MQSLINFDQGRGYYVDDVKTLQAQIDKLKTVYAGLGAFVVSGCNVTGNVISEGLVCLNNKIIFYPGASNVNFPCYLKEGTSTTQGVRYYDLADANKPAFSTDIVELVNVQPGAGQFIPIAANNTKRTYFSVIAEYLLTIEPNFTGPDHFKYRKDSAGFIHFKPNLYITGNDAQTSFQLPSGYFPTETQLFDVPAITWVDGNYAGTAKGDLAKIEISTAGLVSFTGLRIVTGNGAFFTMAFGMCYQFKAA